MVYMNSIKLNIINIIGITYTVGSNSNKEDYGGKRMLEKEDVYASYLNILHESNVQASNSEERETNLL